MKLLEQKVLLKWNEKHFFLVWKVLSIRLEVGLSPSKKFVFIYFNASPLKIMKDAFYFIWKAFFVLGIFTFLSWLYGYVEKGLDKKAMVNFKTYDATDCTINNYNTHWQCTYWPISQEVKATRIKFGQLIKYSMRNTFLEISCTKCGGEASPRPSPR